jgi:mannose-6-phosphate isomerase
MEPIILGANQPTGRFYRGGPRIAAFRRVADDGVRGPEDWVASVTTVSGDAVAGRTRLPDGRPLVDAIGADPILWLGPEHVAAFGSDTKILVKLLDAGERLPVHAHPGVAFASAQLGAAHGKAEAWYLLSPGEVFIGLQRDVSLAELAQLVESQDVERMLALMHRVELQPGETVYVPPGLLHAIGEGILLVEVQEPEDLSILLEWRDFDIDGLIDGHLGLGFDIALGAVEVRGRSTAEIESLIGRGSGPGSVLPPDSQEFFRLDRVVAQEPTDLPAGFAVLVVVDGELELSTESGAKQRMPSGTTAVIPHATGRFQLDGNGVALLARPPLP